MNNANLLVRAPDNGRVPPAERSGSQPLFQCSQILLHRQDHVCPGTQGILVMLDDRPAKS